MGDTTPNGRYLGQISDGQRSLQVTLEIDGSNLPEYLKGTLWGSAGQQDVLLEMEDGQQMSFEGFFGPDRLTCDKIWIQRAQHWSGCGDDESSLSCPLAEVDIERMKVANTLIRRANGPTLFHLTGPSCCWPINVSQKSSYEGWIKLDIHGGSLQLHDSVGVKASIIPFCFSDGHFSDKDGVRLRGHYALKLEEEKKSLDSSVTVEHELGQVAADLCLLASLCCRSRVSWYREDRIDEGYTSHIFTPEPSKHLNVHGSSVGPLEPQKQADFINVGIDSLYRSIPDADTFRQAIQIYVSPNDQDYTEASFFMLFCSLETLLSWSKGHIGDNAPFSSADFQRIAEKLRNAISDLKSTGSKDILTSRINGLRVYP